MIEGQGNWTYTGHLHMYDQKEDSINAMQLHFYLPDNGRDSI